MLTVAQWSEHWQFLTTTSFCLLLPHIINLAEQDMLSVLHSPYKKALPQFVRTYHMYICPWLPFISLFSFVQLLFEVTYIYSKATLLITYRVSDTANNQPYERLTWTSQSNHHTCLQPRTQALENRRGAPGTYCLRMRVKIRYIFRIIY